MSRGSNMITWSDHFMMAITSASVCIYNAVALIWSWCCAAYDWIAPRLRYVITEPSIAGLYFFKSHITTSHLII